MDMVTLEKANEAKRKLERLESFISALEAPYMNSIRASNFVGNTEKAETLIFERKDELQSIILDYCIRKADELREFISGL